MSRCLFVMTSIYTVAVIVVCACRVFYMSVVIDLFDNAMQLRGADHPVGALRAAVAEDVEVVGTAIEDVNETDSLGGRSDQLDHAAPDFGLARSLQTLVRVLVLRHRLTIEQLLSRQSENLTAGRIDHHRTVQEEAESVSIPRRPQPLD